MILPKRLSSLAAGIVCFHPVTALLESLVDVVAAEVGRVYLFNNAPLEPALRDTLSSRKELRFLDATTNLGIGAALNSLVQAATDDGFEGMVVFDQDSRPTPGTVGRLEAGFAALARSGVRPAAVGPRLVAPACDPASKAPRYRVRSGLRAQGALVPVDFLPTSGSLFDLNALRDIALFRADYFIDGVDLEWSFRAWARGFSCWMAGDIPMQHSVGTGTIVLPFGFTMPNQKPFRMYCHLRNTIYGFRLPHVPLRWKAKQAAYMTVQAAAFAWHHRFRRQAVAPLLAGVRDGLLGRLGAPPEAPE